MKKIKYLIVALFLILLTGCSSYDMSMSINKNKSIESVIEQIYPNFAFAVEDIKNMNYPLDKEFL